MQKSPEPLVYKILSADVWKAADGQVVPSMSIDVADGFIHLSTAAQLGETLALHFKNQSELALLAIRVADIEANLVWETSRGGQLFPHVYGQIPQAAVVSMTRVDVSSEGSCDQPPDFM